MVFGELMNIPEFARIINAAMWTPHPTSNIIKELVTETKFYCDNTQFDQSTRIKKNLKSGVYPIHLIRQAKRRYRYSNAVVNTPVEEEDLEYPMLSN